VVSVSAIVETAWQLPQVRTALECKFMAIVLAESSSDYQINACDNHGLPATENSAFLIVEATVCCTFYKRSQEVVGTKASCKTQTIA